MPTAGCVRIILNPTVSNALESEPCVQLNLTPSADRREYSADVIGEIALCILEDGISVPSQGKRTLRVAGDGEIWMRPCSYRE